MKNIIDNIKKLKEGWFDGTGFDEDSLNWLFRSLSDNFDLSRLIGMNEHIFAANVDFEGIGVTIPVGIYRIVQNDGFNIILEDLESKKRYFTTFVRMEYAFEQKKLKWIEEENEMS